jgi:hypothetical protein
MLPLLHFAVTRTSPKYFSPHLTQRHRPPESEKNMGPRAAGQEMCHQVPSASCCTVRLLKLQPLVERGACFFCTASLRAARRASQNGRMMLIIEADHTCLGIATSATQHMLLNEGMKSVLQYRLVYTLRNNRVALKVNVATADARRSQKLAIEVCNNQFRGSPT